MNRLKAVQNLAERKREQLGLVPPINMDEVVSLLGIEVIEERNNYGIEAYSILGDSVRIVINPEMTYYIPRRNFTLAHEIGHILIPWHNGDLKCALKDDYINLKGKRLIDTQEMEANLFASDFLMPPKWLEEEIALNPEVPFSRLVEMISKKANTSIMACFYALERALPSGYVYFVKLDTSEWWSFFSSKNTYSFDWFSFYEERMSFFEKIALSKEQSRLGSYEVIVYRTLPCPSRETIFKKIINNGSGLERLIDDISYGIRLRVLPFIDMILNSITEDNYIAFLYQGYELVRTFYSEKCPLLKLCRVGYDVIENIADYYGLNYESVEFSNNIRLLVVTEKIFKLLDYSKEDPSIILKQICLDVGYDRHMLQSINGIMGSINSMYGKEYSVEELYNWCMYRFISDSRLAEFVAHKDFKKYIANKVFRMKNK